MAAVSTDEYLDVDLPVVVKPCPKDPKGLKRFTSAIRGWCKDEYVLCDFPPNPRLASWLEMRSQCITEFLHDGNVCGFVASVQSLGTIRDPQIRLTWPTQIEVICLRKHERVRTAIPCAVTLPHGKDVPAEIRDISAGGCNLVAKDYVQKNTDLMIKALYANAMPFDKVRAICRSVLKNQAEWNVGCQFVELEDQVRHEIEFYVASMIDRMRYPEQGGPRVLLLERDAKRLGRIRDLLCEDGYEVATALTVVDACYRLRLQPPHAVVVGLEHLELSGADFCRLLRTTRGCEALPIVVFDPGQAEQSREAGADSATVSVNDTRGIQEKIARFVPIDRSKPSAAAAPGREDAAE